MAPVAAAHMDTSYRGVVCVDSADSEASDLVVVASAHSTAATDSYRCPVAADQNTACLAAFERCWVVAAALALAPGTVDHSDRTAWVDILVTVSVDVASAGKCCPPAGRIAAAALVVHSNDPAADIGNPAAVKCTFAFGCADTKCCGDDRCPDRESCMDRMVTFRPAPMWRRPTEMVVAARS